ncbi:U1 snRNP-associated protein Usp105 [Schizosaccharomyces japonicus yFS275]|uniref:U1 snRNP-associated protein Usp105 n=1 Tax=Schizosaccharomyces japonicus (strain yFS275 / FY16936) TaxID=402676 RepID=B6JUT3_SCHJY|nr:U1 snRNP-associated protein Usp105 [Schizosaccharomyces japonicus yFS275]EEB05064.1 U1 snRNP-associated protein Usp105 [Schizosaccharomyces japonicus yFS275]
MDYGDIYITEETEWDNCNRQVAKNPDDFDAWEALVRASEGLEGGVNRNSSKQTLDTLRGVYDRFLTKFPLLFGYWKKYADLEFYVAGVEAAERVYERGIAGIPCSVDLWANYCAFKMETSHKSEEIRELFQAGAESIGLDFLSHPFWDKYIEFEERQERQDNVFRLLERLIRTPLHQYARYFEKFMQVAQTQSLNILLPEDVLASVRADVLREPPKMVNAGSKQMKLERGELEIEREMRARIHRIFLQQFQQTQTETVKRWTFESEIKRPYFHVKELDETQLTNWRKYLDFEEVEGDFNRIVFLYEKCLVACALYDEFWFRYARWMSSKPGHEQDVKMIYERAAAIFTSISRPGLRIQYALLQEKCGNVDTARIIYQSILTQLPGNLEAVMGWVGLERRIAVNGDLSMARSVLRSIVNEGQCDPSTAAIFITEDIKLTWKIEGNIEAARQAFQQNAVALRDSRYFWINYLTFELEQPLDTRNAAEHFEHVSSIINTIRKDTNLPPRTIKDLARLSMDYLLNRAQHPNAIQLYFELDRDTFGPFSVRKHDQSRLVQNGNISEVEARLLSMQGHPGIAVNEARIKMGESPYEKYFRSQGIMKGSTAQLPTAQASYQTTSYASRQ